MSKGYRHEFKIPPVVGEADVRLANGISNRPVASPVNVAQDEALFAWSFYGGHGMSQNKTERRAIPDSTIASRRFAVQKPGFQGRNRVSTHFISCSLPPLP